jgi:hypothetical protein
MKKNSIYILGYVAVIGVALYFLQQHKNKQREKIYESNISETEALSILNKLK